MAEILGVVASGVSVGAFAAQITSSVIKLKSFWDQIHDAPEDIRDLIEQIEDLNRVLTDIKDDQEQNPISRHVIDRTTSLTCLKRCQDAADRLKDLVDTLTADLDAGSNLRKRRGSLKVVLKKEKIKRYEKKLEGTIRLLFLAYQSYNASSQKLQTDIIMTKLLETAVSLPALTTETFPPDHEVGLTLSTQPMQADDHSTVSLGKRKHTSKPWTLSTPFGGVSYSKRWCSFIKRLSVNVAGRIEENEEFIIQYRAPAWLIKRAWEIQILKAASGWTFRPKVFNVVPRASLIFEYARDDYTEGIEALFREKKASPYDRDERGFTPLHFAACDHRYSTCKFLIQQGADVDQQTHVYQFTPQHTQFVGYDEDARTPEGRKTILDTARLLLSETDLLPASHLYSASAETFALWQQSTEPWYYEQPLQERVKIAIGVASLAPWEAKPEVFRAALTRDTFPTSAIFMTDTEGKTLLHAVAENIGNGQQSHLVQDDPVYSLITDWRRMLKELIFEGADYHNISLVDFRTPLLSLFARVFKHSRVGIEETPHELLTYWLEELDDCGVDLEEYGQTETELFEKGHVSWYFSGWANDSDGSEYGVQWRLAILSYGRQPSDWSFSIEECEKPLAHDPEQSIPGGWVEEDDSPSDGSSRSDESSSE